MQLDTDQVIGLILGQGGALVVLIFWLVWTLKDNRRLQKMCNRRTEDYLDLVAEMSGVKTPRRRGEAEEDATNHGV